MAKNTLNTDDARDQHGNPAGILEQANDLFDESVALRRELHKWPELGNHLPRTRDAVLAALQGLPLDITLHETTSGIAAMLTGDKPGDTVLIRGDMDALPMPEDTDLDFKSNIENAMHACGHDTHTSMLVGAAKLLSARKADITGRVLFMFQPGEEGFNGASEMLNEGLLDVGTESPITGAYAIHAGANIPGGFIGLKGGTIMASSDFMIITVKGRGGHGSAPHFTLDPVPVACEIVQALQTLVTRRVDVFDPGVISVTQIHTGTANNVIPETATINGTIRAVSERTRSLLHDGIRRVAEGIAAAHGMEAEVDLHIGYDVTVNNEDKASFAADVATAVSGDRNVRIMDHPVMGAEDFSYVLNRVPGAMMFLGLMPEGMDIMKAAPNHSNRAIYEETQMRRGIAVYSSLALRHLGVPLS
ncbi:MAG: amidohydrolase [Actinobacteria bacterium]|jgi:hippurate hydrolase|nr:amidohydrolase [Actinomycetota bacterium]